MPPRRRLARRVLAVLVGTALALVAAEFLYRVTRLDKLSPTTHPGYVMYDAELGWAYRPNARARHVSAEFDVAIEINAQGFRGPDWPTRSNRPLVVVLGDSMVFGWGVEENESVSALLRTSHSEWDLRGLGISGYAPDQQLLLLRRISKQWQPDVVVCVSSSNDAYEVASAVMYGLPKPRFACDGRLAKLIEPPAAEGPFHAHSMLVRALSKMAWSWQFARSEIPEDWDLVAALYRTMRADCAAASFVLVAANQQLAALAQSERDVTYVDLNATLPASVSTWRFPVDGHWTVAGHRQVASAVADAVAKILDKRRR